MQKGILKDNLNIQNLEQSTVVNNSNINVSIEIEAMYKILLLRIIRDIWFESVFSNQYILSTANSKLWRPVDIRSQKRYNYMNKTYCINI